MRAILRIVVVLAGFSLQARAGLEFAAERLVLDTAPDAELADADFAFTNKGPDSVKITNVMSSCQCLSAEAPEGEIKPGAEGKVHSVFKVGAFSGTVEKQLVVRYEEAGRVLDKVLTVVVKVPELIRVEPTTLKWIVGGEAKEQTFRVLMLAEEPIHLMTVKCSRPEFDFTVEKVKDGREYLVKVKPTKLEEPMLSLFTFDTDCKFPKFRNVMAFGQAGKPAPSKP